MDLTVIGCGDAFGSGGRLNTCFHVQARNGIFLIDCGATALIGLKKFELDPNAIETIFISHLHGDHFAGLSWFLIDAQHVSKRTDPLTIVGPEGIEARFLTATEALFPRATQIERRFALTFVELENETPLDIAGISVTPYEVVHYSGAPPYALRFAIDDKVLSFSGDTEWTESLVPAAHQADLFICECYQFDLQLKFHLDYVTIVREIEQLGAKHVLLTHMSEAMLARVNEIDETLFSAAHDGMTLKV